MRQRFLLAALGCCLLISGQVRAAGESYLLAFKDPINAKRNYQIDLTAHVEAGYKGMAVPAQTTTDVHITGKALETVLDNNGGGAGLSLMISGRKAGVTTNAANGVNWPAGFKSGDWPDYAMTYRRAPAGMISAVTCVSGKLPSDTASSPLAQLAADILTADSLTLNFPVTPVKIGGHWSEKVSTSLGQLQAQTTTATPAAADATATATPSTTTPAATTAPASTGNAKATMLTADIVKHYTLQGVQLVDGKNYLVITCAFDSGNKTIQQTAPSASGALTKITLHVRVKEQSTFLFDPQSGEIYRVTTVGNAQYHSITAQPGNTVTFNMTRNGSSTITRVP